MRLPAAALLACLIVSAALAGPGKYNPALAPGDVAPDFKDLPDTAGKKVSLADFKSKDVVVVVFLCVSCPAVEDYEPRILAFAKKYAGKVGIVAINANKDEDDSPAKMKERAEKVGYPFAYLFDETQKTAKAFGAAYTPEFFVLDKARRVVYTGALDDRDNPKLAKVNFLDAAVDAALAGKTPETRETLGRGCRIDYVEPKRKGKKKG